MSFIHPKSDVAKCSIVVGNPARVLKYIKK